MKIAITGANGQLGQSLQQLAAHYANDSFTFFSSQDWNITHPETTEKIITTLQPDVVINAAAYTAVDRAETEVEKAFAVNAKAVEYLSTACDQSNCRLIHVSTDYVFDGHANKPYTEQDAVNPQGVYGQSKLAGESAALLGNNKNIVVRTSWVYSQYGGNFVKTMLRLMNEKPLIRVVNDQIGSPTYAPDLAEALIVLATTTQASGGIYHFSNSGAISWYEFAKAIKDFAHKQTVVEPIPTSEYPTPAKRPAWSVLDCGKIALVGGIDLKPWRPSLEKCISLLMEQ